MHRLHPTKDDPDDAILFDDCPRCAEHAELGGLALDSEHFRQAWRRMLAVQTNKPFGPPLAGNFYRTVNERFLCQHLYQIAVLLERNGDEGIWERFVSDYRL